MVVHGVPCELQSNVWSEQEKDETGLNGDSTIEVPPPPPPLPAPPPPPRGSWLFLKSVAPNGLRLSPSVKMVEVLF